MRRAFFISLLLAGAATVLTVQAAPQKPNIIMLFIDDLGVGDIGAFGCKDIPTPHIDRLAKEGVMLTQMYVTNPPCCPSRYSCACQAGMGPWCCLLMSTRVSKW